MTTEAKAPEAEYLLGYTEGWHDGFVTANTGLLAALEEVIADCPSCRGEGSFLEYDNVTGKNLWTDCAPCSRARAAIAAAKGGRDAG